MVFVKGTSWKRVIKPHHKDFVTVLLTEYKTPTEIIEAVKEKYNVKIAPNQIYGVKRRRKDLITKVRVNWLKELSDIPIAQKRVRLERLEKQYDECSELPSKYNKLVLRLRCLNQAQEEVEGKTKLGDTFMSFQQNTVFSNMTDKELLEEQKKIMGRIKGIKVPVIDIKKEESDAQRKR